MNFVLQPWQLLVFILAGWVQRQQQQIIEFQNEQIKVLLERQGKKRILLTDDQRRRLAVKGKALGRKALSELTTIVTPDTILRWHRELVAAKWDYSEKRPRKPGRPPISDEVSQLIVRMANENPSWGYDRIQGALANLGHEVSDTTVGNVLKDNGIEPAPERKRKTAYGQNTPPNLKLRDCMSLRIAPESTFSPVDLAAAAGNPEESSFGAFRVGHELRFAALAVAGLHPGWLGPAATTADPRVSK